MSACLCMTKSLQVKSPHTPEPRAEVQPASFPSENCSPGQWEHPDVLRSHTNSNIGRAAPDPIDPMRHQLPREGYLDRGMSSDQRHASPIGSMSRSGLSNYEALASSRYTGSSADYVNGAAFSKQSYPPSRVSALD